VKKKADIKRDLTRIRGGQPRGIDGPNIWDGSSKPKSQPREKEIRNSMNKPVAEVLKAQGKQNILRSCVKKTVRERMGCRGGGEKAGLASSGGGSATGEKKKKRCLRDRLKQISWGLKGERNKGDGKGS